MKITRKQFIKKVGITGIASALTPSSFDCSNLNHSSSDNKGKGLKVLFQGDSITDGGRSRNNDWNHVMGHGYAYLVSSALWYDFSGLDLMFYNRGVSGDKISDLETRWQEDTFDLKPDLISILVGVNDLDQIVEKKYTIEDWKTAYTNIIKKTSFSLPDAKIILCEPFLLPYAEMTRIDWTKEKAASHGRVMAKMQNIVSQLAMTYNLTFVPLQKTFEEACKKAPANYWIWDGIHPKPAGHELTARKWLKEVKEKLSIFVD